MNRAFEKKAIEQIAKIFLKLGLSKLFLAKKTHKLILMYHNPDPIVFTEHIKFLKQNFGFANLVKLLEKKEGGISLTFDDAYQNIPDFIFPILKQEQIPAVIFVPTAYCGKLYWAEALKEALKKTKKTKIEIKGFQTIYLSSAADAINAWHTIVNWTEPWSSKKRDKKIVEIIQLLEVNTEELSTALVSTEKSLSAMQPLVELGSHTLTHANLAKLEEKSLHEELAASKKRVEEISGRKCTLFGYPFGKKSNISSLVIRVVNETGYKYAFTATPSFGNSTDPYTVGRIGIGDNDSVALLCLKLSVFWKILKLLSIVK